MNAHDLAGYALDSVRAKADPLAAARWLATYEQAMVDDFIANGEVYLDALAGGLTPTQRRALERVLEAERNQAYIEDSEDEDAIRACRVAIMYYQLNRARWSLDTYSEILSFWHERGAPPLPFGK